MENRAILLVFDKNYLNKAKGTIEQIRNIGEYYDDIVCIIGDDLLNYINEIESISNNVIVKYFPEINRSEQLKLLAQYPIGDGRTLSKTIQWHKLYCFHEYFKNWKKCLYIDSGMRINKSLEKIFNIDVTDSFIAHSDAYPTYEWTLECQFDKIMFPNLYNDLRNNFDLNRNYFQTGIMLFDTNIIKSNTFLELISLSKKYFLSRTNEQGILNLYFNNIYNIWKQIPIKDNETYYYDYWNREGLHPEDYIMIKYIRK